MDECEIYAYDAYVQNIHDDLRIVANADFNSLDDEKLKIFLEKARVIYPISKLSKTKKS